MMANVVTHGSHYEAAQAGLRDLAASIAAASDRGFLLDVEDKSITLALTIASVEAQLAQVDAIQDLAEAVRSLHPLLTGTQNTE